MTKIERLGMNLAEEIRREHELSVELQSVKEKIDRLIESIRFAEEGTLYEMTGEQELVRPYIDPVPDLTETVRIDLDQTVAGVGMSPIVPCPGLGLYRGEEDACTIEHRHVHTADGKLHVLPE